MHFHILLLICLLLFSPSIKSYSQDKPQTTRKMKKRIKDLKKKKKQQDEETVDVSEKLRERHRENQNKATKKRMKKNKKKAKRINQNKRELFLNRWWRKISVSIKTVFRKKS